MHLLAKKLQIILTILVYFKSYFNISNLLQYNNKQELKSILLVFFEKNKITFINSRLCMRQTMDPMFSRTNKHSCKYKIINRIF